MQLKPQALADQLRVRLPLFITIWFALQPLLDILAYWLDRLEYSNALTLLLRFAVLAVVLLAGFCLSQKKRVYIIAAGVLVFLLLGHCVSCFYVGYTDIVGDVSYFVRTAQLPLFTLCLITFLRENEDSAAAVENGLILNFWIIALSVLLSAITGTAKYTYTIYTTYTSGYAGIIGWFATGSAQSAILSMLSALAVILTYRKRKLWLFALTTAAAFALLYFMGPRLAFFTIPVIAVGLLLTALLTHRLEWKPLVVLGVCTALCFAFIRQAPMMARQNDVSKWNNTSQSTAESMMEEAAQEAQMSRLEEGETESDLSEEEQALIRYEQLKIVYEYYEADLCERFGVDRVIEGFHETTSLSTLRDYRVQKRVFCALLMDEHPFISRIFGIEVSEMTYNGREFVPENGFHGVYYMYGWAGLIALLLFLAYFLFLIVRCLIRDFKTYFTMEAGAFGAALCLCLVYAYATNGVIWRPSGSFYFSVLLAMVYYLIKIREYPQVQPTQLPAEEEQNQ
ncbi:MAG: O-antigen ligase family protein [Oscillospiraceae bacterium]|nr:O-antigen ligase family protein [Oscillospiraceae bacterium]